jgi:hypothetical protein
MTVNAFKMTNTIRRLTVALAIVSLAGFWYGQAAAENGGVTVVRGSPSDGKGIDVSRDDRDKITVFRGQPSFETGPALGETAAPSGDIDLISGYNGWFIDRTNNRIVNCYGVQGTQVGQRRIRCVSKRL